MDEKYLETPDEVSRVLEGGINYFSSKGNRIVFGTDRGRYSTNQKTFKEFKPYERGNDERTIGSLTLGDLGLLTSKPTSEPKSSYAKGYSN